MESQIKNYTEEIVGSLKEPLNWKWDERFNAHLSEFGNEQEEEINSILEKILPFSFDRKSIKKAPKILKTAAKTRLFGIQKKQLIFSTDPEEGVYIICAWWPWNDGSRVSLRIIIEGAENNNNLAEEINSTLNRLIDNG